MTHIEYDRPYLYEKQKKAVFDPKRYSIIEASTKSGKTAGCIVYLVEKALEGQSGQNFWWIAPVTSQAAIAFRRALLAIPRELYTVNLSDKCIRLYNGTLIWFKSADKPNSLYGEDVYAAVIDEASRMKEDAYYAIRSTLTKTRGPIRIIGNVMGRKNWFYNLARKAEAGDPAMGYHKIVASDAVRAGVLADQEIKDAKRNLPEHVFKELYLAEPSDNEGNPFGIDAIRKCIVPLLSAERPVVWGWDLAKSEDFTVGIALDENCRVCRIVRFQIAWELTVPRILEATGKVAALVDSTGVGDPILERLQTKAFTKFEGFKFSSNSKQQLMEGLALAINTRQVSYPAGPIVVELEEFEYETRPTGVRYAARAGCFDDCVCALALAVMHFNRTRKDRGYSSMKWVK